MEKLVTRSYAQLMKDAKRIRTEIEAEETDIRKVRELIEKHRFTPADIFPTGTWPGDEEPKETSTSKPARESQAATATRSTRASSAANADELSPEPAPAPTAPPIKGLSRFSLNRRHKSVET